MYIDPTQGRLISVVAHVDNGRGAVCLLSCPDIHESNDLLDEADGVTRITHPNYLVCVREHEVDSHGILHYHAINCPWCEALKTVEEALSVMMDQIRPMTRVIETLLKDEGIQEILHASAAEKALVESNL